MRRVVITGAGVVSPLGTGIDRFFEGLRQARAGVDLIESFDASGFPTRIAAEVRDLDLSAVAVAVAGPDAALLRRDRKGLFGLVAARQAIAQAFGGARPCDCYEPDRLAAFCATGLEVFHLQDLVAGLTERGIDLGRLGRAGGPAVGRLTLQIPSDLAVRAIVQEAGIRGLVHVNVSACAAGTQALGEALRAIREGAADAAVAGGFDSMVNPLGLGGFCLLGALSRSNELRGAASRPFDARRDGFVLGEGAGFCMLEERSAALSRGAQILAELRGYGSSLDAFRVSDPDPEHAGATGCMRAALADAGVRADELDYINAHGTATRKNDPAETAAIRAVLGAAADRTPVSSTKSQIGHLIGAAGAVEALAVLFALREGLLPATINWSEPDPGCDLDYVPGTPRAAHVRTALSTSFGFGGQNAALVIGRGSDD